MYLEYFLDKPRLSHLTDIWHQQAFAKNIPSLDFEGFLKIRNGTMFTEH